MAKIFVHAAYDLMQALEEANDMERMELDVFSITNNEEIFDLNKPVPPRFLIWGKEKEKQ